jgi:hypothetical protein
MSENRTAVDVAQVYCEDPGPEAEGLNCVALDCPCLPGGQGAHGTNVPCFASGLANFRLDDTGSSRAEHMECGRAHPGEL